MQPQWTLFWSDARFGINFPKWLAPAAKQHLRISVADKIGCPRTWQAGYEKQTSQSLRAGGG